MKKVIGFCGSPKKGSNTENLLKKVLEGAEKAGAETEWHDVKKLTLGNCLGCAGCRRNNDCVIKDDMTEMINKVKNADSVVFASPIYMLQMTAHLKIFIERMWPIMRPDNSSILKKDTKAQWLFTQGTPTPQAFQAYFDHNDSMMEHFGFKVEKAFVVGNTRAKGDFEKQEDAVNKALEIGMKLV